ncbi:MAG TPA: hypothetical protein VH437_02655 [Terriglobales bacterium]
MNRPVVLTAVVSLFLVFVEASSAQTYSITDIGRLSPAAINMWGQVVGDYNGHAFLWTKWGGMQDLGTLAGGTYSSAGAINDLGVVTGVADGPGTIWAESYPPLSCDALNQPFTWTKRTGMVGLNDTAYAGLRSEFGDSDLCQYLDDYPSDINAHSQIVGSNRELGTYKWGFSGKTDGQPLTIYADVWQTALSGINNWGQMSGYTTSDFLGYDLFYESHAATWTQGVKTDLGTLGGNADDWSYCSGAGGISDLGFVVGWSTISSSARPCMSDVYNTQASIHAVLWQPGLGIQDLGTLPGDSSSAAQRVNFFGQVIGSSGNTISWQDGKPGGGLTVVIGRPFIWTQHNGMRDLNSLIPRKSGWVLTSVSGINVWGQIVGSGVKNGQTHGFLLTPRFFFQESRTRLNVRSLGPVGKM